VLTKPQTLQSQAPQYFGSAYLRTPAPALPPNKPSLFPVSQNQLMCRRLNTDHRYGIIKSWQRR
jgi:hypothetical protein